MSAFVIDKNNICALVVTFNPPPEFPRYLAAICKQFPYVLAINNGSREKAWKALAEAGQDNIELIDLGGNQGLGAALNRGIAAAGAKGFHWVALFDQDSEPICTLAEHYISILGAFPNPHQVAVIGARFSDRNRPDTISSTPQPPVALPYEIVRRVITSGSLISLDAYAAIGPFREDLFLDLVDHEYCERAREKGWIVLRSTIALLSHSVGHYRKHYILGFAVWRSHHSAARCYFMFRNRILLARESGAPFRALRGVGKALWYAVLVVLCEEDKAGKLGAILQGALDGLRKSSSTPAWIRHSLV